ncbi:MAG TPA: heme o synthase [Pyrinomonadaceae bacterium]|jgi:protoheme IX farnesyltransferase|nr:heme o synthase [Pyrinomonadaceae bacterium]
METAAVEIREQAIDTDKEAVKGGRFAAYFELTKPRIAVMLLLTAAAGFYSGSAGRAFDWALFGNAMLGIVLLAFGVATLNQFIERETDKLMRRTAVRPLPTGKLSAVEALIFGILLCLAAETYLAIFVNPLTAILGLSVIVGYVLLYTPLKTRTTLSTVVGAFPGAMPPLMGWTAASNEITFGAWALFWILFLWQFPHFFAIAWMYRDEYKRAGILMLPVVEPAGRITAQQIVVFAALTLGISFAPFFLGLTHWIYLVGAAPLGIWFLATGIRFARAKSDENARWLLRVSIMYLPLLFGLLVLTRN